MNDLNELTILYELTAFLIERGDTKITKDGIDAFINNAVEDYEEELKSIIESHFEEVE